MAEQIEQMTAQIETNNKVYLFVSMWNKNIITCLIVLIAASVCFLQQFEELQQKYDSEVQRAADFTNRLHFTQVK